MGIRYPDRPDKDDHIRWKLKPSLNCSKFVASIELNKGECEVIRCVYDRIENKLNANTHNHHNTKNGGFFLQRVVVLEDKPFQPHFDPTHDDDEHPEDT